MIVCWFDNLSLLFIPLINIWVVVVTVIASCDDAGHDPEAAPGVHVFAGRHENSDVRFAPTPFVVL